MGGVLPESRGTSRQTPSENASSGQRDSRIPRPRLDVVPRPLSSGSRLPHIAPVLQLARPDCPFSSMQVAGELWFAGCFVRLDDLGRIVQPRNEVLDAEPAV